MGKAIETDVQYVDCHLPRLQVLPIKSGEAANSLEQVVSDNPCSAKGADSVALGMGTQTGNTAECAVGQFNASHENTIHSVGIGTADSRKNAIEVMSDGKQYVLGLGGYDGTNPGASGVKDIADLINALVTAVGDLKAPLIVEGELDDTIDVFTAYAITFQELVDAFKAGRVILCCDTISQAQQTLISCDENNAMLSTLNWDVQGHV